MTGTTPTFPTVPSSTRNVLGPWLCYSCNDALSNYRCNAQSIIRCRNDEICYAVVRNKMHYYKVSKQISNCEYFY